MKHSGFLLLACLVIIIAAGAFAHPLPAHAAQQRQGTGSGLPCQPASIVLVAAESPVNGISPRAGASIRVLDAGGVEVFSESIGNDGRVFLGLRPAGVSYTVVVGDLPDLPGFQVQLTPACECLIVLDGYVQTYRIGVDGAMRETGACAEEQACSSVRLAGTILPEGDYTGAVFRLRDPRGILVSTGTIGGVGPLEIGRVISGSLYRFQIDAAQGRDGIDQVISVPCQCDTAGGLLQLDYYWISSSYVTPIDRGCRASSLPLLFKQ